MAQDIPIFLINLDRRPDRLEYMAHQLDAMGVEWERVPALDAATASPEDYAPFVRLDRHQMFTTPGSLSLSRTNFRIFELIVERGLPGGLILQDDAELSPDLGRLVQNADWAPDEFGMIQMEWWHGRSNSKLVGPGVPLKDVPGRTVHRLHSKSVGAACFFVRDWAARRMVENPVPVDIPGDHYLFNPGVSPVFKPLKTAMVFPALARQNNKGELGTDITGKGNKRAIPRGNKLRKELLTLRAVPGLAMAYLRGARLKTATFRA